MTMVEIWPTFLLGEEYLRRFPARFRGRTLLVGIKGLREVPFCGAAAVAGAPLVIVEPWLPNAQYACEHYPGAYVAHLAVQDFVELCEAGTVAWPDVVIWLQGPEHVPKETALTVLETFRTHSDLVLAEMPHGKHVQGADGGNPFEEHLSYLYVDDFDPDLWDIALSHDEQPKEDLEAKGELNGVRHLLVASKSKPVAADSSVESYEKS